MEYDVCGRRSAGVCGRGGPAQYLLDAGRQEERIRAEKLPLLGMVDECQDPPGDGVARGVATGSHKQAEEHLQLCGREPWRVFVWHGRPSDPPKNVFVGPPRA